MGYNMTMVYCPKCGSRAEFDCETETVYCQPCIARRHDEEDRRKRRQTTCQKLKPDPFRRRDPYGRKGPCELLGLTPGQEMTWREYNFLRSFFNQIKDNK
ncbi:hypothetical protein COT97_05305 [Candidatus Falkowbacteria bacterium CG10_big_fil_rev_8_21_14_0_10_39_11]|uniref:Uncharacterized protein n=1 Tax=Candidatus Falkowbacteria bacterium CG10_big_fil_rev_8_21_14_0_10_39_11 TaxID=1974565 RepID=A0A2H0V5P5_9BACT|nr:MAG: hypothetical protein COT97_05305 [Candidatus Falkowbacteria bacterium CG10_big_fil_rev_8_21_14_0_10_39_11]